jgi:uncharacterized membrane protein (DUF485 family)
MKEHTEQHLDSLAKKVMKSASLQSPSVDFTSNLMEEIKHATIGESLTYKPLISKNGWFAIIAGLIVLSMYIIFGNVEGPGLLDTVDYSAISNNKVFNAITEIKISKILTYAIGFCGLVFFIQIPLMKHMMNKRLEY